MTFKQFFSLLPSGEGEMNMIAQQCDNCTTFWLEILLERIARVNLHDNGEENESRHHFK